MVRSTWLSVMLVASLVALFSTSALQAQGKPNYEKARITTVDGVDLAGHFYPAKVKNPPTVLLLHALGEDSKKKNWVSLAEQLQAEGFAVMAFDFRGHGNSTTISDPNLFWSQQANANAVKAKVKGDTLDFKNILPTSYTLFCNDIAAVRGWLDRKNDSGACNVSNLILIGAETGATLGAIWLNSEHRRAKLSMNMFMAPKPDDRREGKDVIAAVWLTITPKLGKVGIPVGKVLEGPARVVGTPMAFMHGSEDTSGKDFARKLANDIKFGKDKDKFPYTNAAPVKGTKLQGQGLLLKDLGTDVAIIEYLKGVYDDRNQEWFERDYRKTDYAWITGPQNWIPAKLKGKGDPNNLVFDTYMKFIPQ